MLGSADRRAGSIEGRFDLDRGPKLRRLILDPITGMPIDRSPNDAAGDHGEVNRYHG